MQLRYIILYVPDVGAAMDFYARAFRLELRFLHDDGHAWILFIKQGVRLIPRDVYSGGAKGFVFYFKDDMTPRPFQEDCWKVTLANARLKSHYLIEGSPTHTYLRVNIHNNLEDDEIFADDRDLPVAKLSWSPTLTM